MHYRMWWCAMNSNEDIIIEVKNLTKNYKMYTSNRDILLENISLFKTCRHTTYKALEDVSFSVKKGQTFGIIGKNGAGKSTLLKMITGVSAPSEGEVLVRGKVAALLELGSGFNQEYTGMENIYLNGKIMGYSKKEMQNKVQNIIEFADIGEFINQPVKTYSSGMFARLAFAVAINVEPEVLIVDEALSVGDVFFQNKCYKKFEELKQGGTTILFVSHDIQTVKQMCSSVLWLNNGRVEMVGDSVEVCNAYTNSILAKNKIDNSIEDSSYSVRRISKEIFPAINYSNESILAEDVKIVSCFVTDSSGEIVNVCEINKEYTVSVVFESSRDIKSCIVGFVIENAKGVWIINSNSAINGERNNFRVHDNSLNKVDFKFRMPALMKGEYVIGAAISEGTMRDYKVITWLYNILCITIENKGNNSGMIDIDPQISIFSDSVI